MSRHFSGKHIFISLCISVALVSCVQLEKRHQQLNTTFCNKCEEPLRNILMAHEAIHVVKFNKDQLSYFYEKDKVNLDSLDNMMMSRGFLPRNDSIVMYPVCCSKMIPVLPSKVDSVLN